MHLHCIIYIYIYSYIYIFVYIHIYIFIIYIYIYIKVIVVGIHIAIYIYIYIQALFARMHSAISEFRWCDSAISDSRSHAPFLHSGSRSHIIHLFPQAFQPFFLSQSLSIS